MAIQIGQKPSPTFQQPLELLSDCHRRVESFLQALILVTEQTNGAALNPQHREALQTALRYFREAAPKHTADEEESLFPRMRQLSSEAVGAALEKIERLEADHKVAQHDHQLVEQLGSKWLAKNRLTKDETAQMAEALRRLQSIYERHISIEDNEIFPLAGQVLDAKTLKDVGREMAERRGQRFDLQHPSQAWSKSQQDGRRKND
jgi:hemerythrin-like domain-containing protein